jgi:glycopeptide antibiotics resistance protein
MRIFIEFLTLLANNKTRKTNMLLFWTLGWCFGWVRFKIFRLKTKNRFDPITIAERHYGTSAYAHRKSAKK